MKLIVGAKATDYPGWLSTDLRARGGRLDIRRTEDWSRRFAPNSIDRAVAEHVLEHLTEEDAREGLRNVAAYLKPGGFIRIAVPDANNPDPTYQEHCRPGGKGQAWARLFFYADGEPEHKTHFDFQSLASLMQRAGLSPRLLEYHDAAGVFHRNAWNPNDAPILRHFNSPYNLRAYLPFHGFQNLSLIVDGVKGGGVRLLAAAPLESADARTVTVERERTGFDSTGRLILIAVVAAAWLWDNR
jgi:predicted SAM-dependent methyltransferase